MYYVSVSANYQLYTIYRRDGVHFAGTGQQPAYPHTFAVLSRKPKTVITPTELYYYTDNGESISHKNGNPKQIKDYHVGINSIYEIYKDSKLRKELSFIKRNFIPTILKHQLGRCYRSDDTTRSSMFAEFTKELVDLNNKGLISWRGHKFTRYLIYKKLIKEAQ